jgi:cytoskeletal protein CcmA (bactofilin family)
MANNKDFRVKNNLFVKGLGTSTFSGDVSVGDTITVQGAATFQDDVNFNGAFNPVSINASGNVVIGGNLTVNGTTTTVDTNNLNVKDKNITLNYSTGDSSALANGAGITIQDAVNSTTDATLTLGYYS